MHIEILEQRIAPAAFIVTSLADSGPGTLRSIIALANTVAATTTVPNTIVFAKQFHGNEQIVLKSPLPAITNDLSISNITTGLNLTISGDNKFQIFDVYSPGTAINFTVTNLTLAHGKNVAGSASSVTQAPGGGALYINDFTGGVVTLKNSTVTRNEAIGSSGATGIAGIGGAIDVFEGSVNITSSTISDNLAAGGHSVTAGAPGGNALGGGIYQTQDGILTVTSSTISGNAARGGSGTTGATGAAGGLYTPGYYGGAGGNGGLAQGGGIWSYGTVTLKTSTLSGNTAVGGKGGNGGTGGKGGKDAGGGNGGPGGYAGVARGGGIYSGGFQTYGSYATLNVNSSTISGNTAVGAAGGKGGGRGAGAPHESAGSTGFSQVATLGYGGGIHSANSSLILSQATLAKNAADKGGGIFMYGDSYSSLNNSTIAFNTAHQLNGGGGLFATVTSTVTAISTVIGQNTAGTGHKTASQDLYVADGSYIAASYSLIQTSNDGAVSGMADITGVSPLLMGLGKNGGPTLTCLPSTVSSLLIGAGSNPNNLTHDQRGDAREFGGTIDIGAVEFA